MDYKYSDGGREAAGYKGKTGDCFVRAAAIATGKSYEEVYNLVLLRCRETNHRKRKRRNTPSGGIYREFADTIMAEYGWEWVPIVKPGCSDRPKLKAGDLPKGRILARVTRHFCAVIDDVVHDTHDPRRGGTRLVYGYYRKK